ncbi:MAG: sigma 54-interacting transcriptional regulator [Planctomycetota bacterium]
MLVRLTIIEGKDAGQNRSARLAPNDRFTIGRGSDCNLPLWDEAASRTHAVIERTSAGIFLTDLGSSNGTRVNGEAVECARKLSGGDRIGIGKTEIRVEVEGFQERPTTIVRPDDDFEVESSLAPDAIALASRLADSHSHQQRLDQLLKVVEEAQSAVAGEVILKLLLAAAMKTLEATRGSVIPVARRSQEPLWREAIFEPATDEVTVSRSVVKRVVTDGNALQVRDAATDPRTRTRESIVSRQVAAIVAVPVSSRDRILGVLYVERDGAGFSEEDLAYAATLGQISGMALHNAERLQRSRRIIDSQARARPSDIVTEDAAFLKTVELLARFAASGGPLLIRGETGTGKELMARRAHSEGPFADGPWIPVNCAAIPATLLESELFGHEKGAFTGATDRKAGMFELADGGTLFLDEIGDMPVELQAKLLRVLENGEFYRIGGRAPVAVQLLVVSATHHNLRELVEEERFREDLFFRLARFQVEIPPLRERPDDVALLAQHFLAELATRSGRPQQELSEAALATLQAYSWPGNVRELRNVLERGAVLAGGEALAAADLQLTADLTSARRGSGPPPSLEAVEARAIREAMEYTGGKKGEAAQLLGIAWPTLRRKLKKYEIE